MCESVWPTGPQRVRDSESLRVSDSERLLVFSTRRQLLLKKSPHLKVFKVNRDNRRFEQTVNRPQQKTSHFCPHDSAARRPSLNRSGVEILSWIGTWILKFFSHCSFALLQQCWSLVVEGRDDVHLREQRYQAALRWSGRRSSNRGGKQFERHEVTCW